MHWKRFDGPRYPMIVYLCRSMWSTVSQIYQQNWPYRSSSAIFRKFLRWRTSQRRLLLDSCASVYRIAIFSSTRTHFFGKKGLFMGSSLAPILVERVIEDAVTKTLEKISVRPDFWMIYVDDHLVFGLHPRSPHRHAATITQLVAPTRPVYCRVENCIKYLDMTLIKAGESIKSTWYTIRTSLPIGC